MRHTGSRILIVMLATLTSARALPADNLTQPPAIELSLTDAIQMALENNLDITVERLSVEVQEKNIQVARGVYKPELIFNFQTSQSEQPATNQLTGAESLSTDSTFFDFGFEQRLPTGGSYSIHFDNNYTSTNSSFLTVNPRYDTSFTLGVVQPLLKDRYLDPARQQIVIAQNSEQNSWHQLESRVMDVVQQVESAYWDLAFSIRALEVAERSLGLALDLLEDNRIRAEVGTMTSLDVLEAEAEVARREEAVITSQSDIRRSEDALQRLINDPNATDFWASGIRPTDAPSISEVSVNVEDAVITALEQRPELAQARVELDTLDFNVRYTGNQKLPQLDLVGSVDLTGLGGTQIIREELGGSATELFPGGYWDAVEQALGGDFSSWSLGLQFTYPLGNSSADATHARAQVEVRQQQAFIAKLELDITLEVRDAVREVETSIERLEATVVARELATRRLEAEEERLLAGVSTSFLVVQVQRDMVEAEANELRAMVDYNKALVNLERAQGSLLESVGISLKYTATS